MIDWPTPEEWKELLPGMRGKVGTIDKTSTAYHQEDNALIFAQKITDGLFGKLRKAKGCLFVVGAEHAERFEKIEGRSAMEYTENPRYRYAEILGMLDDRITPEPAQIHPTAVVMEGAVIHDGVTIGANSVIGNNAVIGGQGFGFALDDDRPPLRIRHLGGVNIGEGVEVGALSTVCAGTITPTTIGDHCKIDDHVHVAHNVQMGEQCIITGCVEISGSVTIGDKAWLGPNCAIRNGLSIGAGALVGVGAAVLKSVPDGVTVAGNPARQLPASARRMPTRTNG